MTATILHINSSAREQGSITRTLSAQLVDKLQQQTGAKVQQRDLRNGMPFLDEAWVNANFTDPAQRSREQQAALIYSDSLVDELRQATQLVIAVPIYNFGVPAVLKAWIDQIARARETFRYTENGPEGLLKGKKAFVVIASGGVPIGSAMDFVTPYLKQVLGFIGIEDVAVIDGNSFSQIADNDDEINRRLTELVSA